MTAKFCNTVRMVALLAAISLAPLAQAQPIPPSPQWTQAMPAGPAVGVKMTEEYVKQVGRIAYLWAWPMANLQSRLDTFRPVREFALGGGVLPIGPVNEITMLTDYIEPSERAVACPNQDMVYGQAVLDLTKEPVVVQVPDFGDRFFVYQVVDQRTDSFADIGKMYGTQPGFYLLAGPDWNGAAPTGITRIFRSSTNVGFIIPRVFREDSDADKQAVQPLIRQIMSYPLSRFTGRMQTKDWSKLPTIGGQGGDEETKWVVPEKFFDMLPGILTDVKPLPGEESLHALVRSVLDAAANDSKLGDALTQSAIEAEATIVKPLFEFRNYGIQLPDNWTTVENGAAFGTDYFTRTAVAKSNIFVNKRNETRYYYQDLDNRAERLNGANRYTVTFATDEIPPVNGFWSLTLYNQNHFFEPNDIKRYSIGTKNKALKYNPDGSLTIFVQASPPPEGQRENWLPAPKNGDFSLYIRAYWPKVPIIDGSWTPPPVVHAMHGAR